MEGCDAHMGVYNLLDVRAWLMGHLSSTAHVISPYTEPVLGGVYHINSVLTNRQSLDDVAHTTWEKATRPIWEQV
jgi:hypothetical protein